jgi:hypothetical protein
MSLNRTRRLTCESTSEADEEHDGSKQTDTEAHDETWTVSLNRERLAYTLRILLAADIGSISVTRTPILAAWSVLSRV